MNCGKPAWGSVETAARVAGFASVLCVLAAVNAPARAHEDARWIQDQRLRNQVGEWCCGQGDCEAVDKSAFTVTAGGYRLDHNGETIPFGEASPLSIDGRLWVCRRPNGSRRCVFDKPAGS